MVIIVSVLKINEFLWLDGFKLMNFLSEKAADHRVVPDGDAFDGDAFALFIFLFLRFCIPTPLLAAPGHGSIRASRL